MLVHPCQVRVEQAAILTVDGIKPGAPVDLFFVHQRGVEVTHGGVQ